MGTRVRKLVVAISGEDRGIHRPFERVEDEVDKLGDKLRTSGKKTGKQYGEGFGDEADKSLRSKFQKMSGDLPGILAKGFAKDFAITGKTVATGFSAQFVASVASGLASGAAKMAHGLGAVAALLPAAATAGVLAFGTLKLAVSGVGDALSAGLTGDTEALNEAIQKLSPSARTFATEVVGLKGQLDSLKSLVQENFFGSFADQVRPVGEIYLRQMHLAMGDVASSFGAAVREAAEFLQTPTAFRAIWTTLDNGRQAVDNVVAGLANLLPAILPLLTVGSTFLPQLTAGFDGATTRLAAFMQEAEKTGRIQQFIQGGLDKLRELWATAQQLGRIFGNIRSIASEALDSVGGVFAGLGLETGGLLDTFEGLTERAERFVKTAAGGEAVGQVFSSLASVVSGAMGFLQRIAVLVGRVFGPIMPQVSKLFEAVANLKTAFIDALEPALVSVFGFVGRTVLPALTTFADLLTRNRPLLQGIGIAIATLLLPATISWAAATIAAMAPWILLGAVIAGFAALVIIHFDTIKGVIMGVFNWVKDNWQLLLIILTGPIGVAVALFVEHFDTIKNAVMTAFNWVRDNWQLLLGILTGPIGLAVAFITTNLDSIVSFVTGLPGRITDAASGMWDGISEAFRSAINKIIGWWNNLRIPGFDLNINLPGPVPDIGFSWGGMSLPDIPSLAQGAIALSRPGGTIVRVGEGGHDEAIVPLDGRHSTGGTIVNINRGAFEGAIVSSQSDAERWVVGALNSAMLRGAIVEQRGRRL